MTSLLVNKKEKVDMTLDVIDCNVSSTSLFKLHLAVLICCSNTPPMWLVVGGFLIHVIQWAQCICRYSDIWLWSIFWKAYQSSLIAPIKLVPLSDLIRQMLSWFPVNRLNESVKESVSKDCNLNVNYMTT